MSSTDPYIWSRDLEKHSFAAVQGNEIVEDYRQVEIDRDSLFVGVYDGHGGPHADLSFAIKFFENLIGLAKSQGTISENILREAFSETENGFLHHVESCFRVDPMIAAVGFCCLMGIIWEGISYVANVGRSRAVIGCLDRSNKIVAEQLTKDHKASLEEVRRELKSIHPDDPQIVVEIEGIWRIKGISQVSRSIGDAYLKNPAYFLKFQILGPTRRPILASEPSIHARVIRPNHKFYIFASNGLWEHMTNQEAVEIVHNNPPHGIARRLVKIALRAVAAKRSRMEQVEKGSYHELSS